MKVFRWVEKQLYAGPNQLSLAFYSQFTLRINTATNGLGGGAKTDFAPGRRNPLVRHCASPATAPAAHPPRTRRTPACKAVRVPAPALQMRVPATRVTRRVTRPAQDSSTD